MTERPLRTPRQELARLLHDRCVTYGEFTLRSGETSRWYFDKYKMETHPVLLSWTAKQLRDLVIDIDPTEDGCEYVAGPELGGVVLASHASDRRTLFVRKASKEYGTTKRVEGHVLDLDAERAERVDPNTVILVEDVVTTGGAVLDAAHALEELGLKVVAVCAVLDRGGGTNISVSGYKFDRLFTPEDLGVTAESP